MDPATIGLAITAASKAFGAIKAGFAAGRDIESRGKDLSRWMSAVSDVDNAEKSAKNASPLRKLFKGKEIEASAIEAFTAKKKMEAQRQELKSFINFPSNFVAGPIKACIIFHSYSLSQMLPYMQQRCHPQ